MAKLGIEARAGLFVLAALAVLVGFVLALGDFSLTSGIRLYGDFAYTGGLQTGAPVMVSGVRVGRVSDLSLLSAASQPAPSAGVSSLGRSAAPVVRVSLELNDEAAHLLAADSALHVGTQGLIGESYVEVTPGQGASVEPGAAIRGVDAPRLHVMFLQMSQLLSVLGGLLGEDASADLGQLGGAMARLLSTLDEVLGSRKQELGTAIEDVAVAAADLRRVLSATREAIGDGTALSAMLNDGRAVAGSMRSSLPQLLDDVKRSVAAVDTLATGVSSAIDAEAVAAVVADARQTSARLESISRQLEAIVASVRRGEGSVGGLLTDPQIYDDLKEMLRDLKRNPWKFMWRD